MIAEGTGTGTGLLEAPLPPASPTLPEWNSLCPSTLTLHTLATSPEWRSSCSQALIFLQDQSSTPSEGSSDPGQDYASRSNVLAFPAGLCAGIGWGSSSVVGHLLSIGSTQLPSCHGLFSCCLAPWLCLNPQQLCDKIPRARMGWTVVWILFSCRRHS